MGHRIRRNLQHDHQPLRWKLSRRDPAADGRGEEVPELLRGLVVDVRRGDQGLLPPRRPRDAVHDLPPSAAGTAADVASAWPLSSPTPPDCTVVIVLYHGAKFLLYCRPGDKAWSKFSVDGDELLRPMHGCGGRIYAISNVDWELLVINMDSTSGVHIDEREEDDEDTRCYVPCPYKMSPVNGDYLSDWVESDGDDILLRFYLYGCGTGTCIALRPLQAQLRAGREHRRQDHLRRLGCRRCVAGSSSRDAA